MAEKNSGKNEVFKVARKSLYKEDKSMNISIRIRRELVERYNEAASKTNRSRNELIGMALQYAIDHMVVEEENTEEIPSEEEDT